MPREHARRAYCLVPTAVWQEDSTPEQRGICVGLVAYMVERWARDKLTAKQAERVVLRPGVLAEITGRERLGAGLARLQQALGTTSARAWQEGRNVVVEWPKVAIYQRLDRRDTPLSVTATATATASAKNKRKPTVKSGNSEADLGHCPPLADWLPEQVSAVSKAHTEAETRYAIAFVSDWHLAGGSPAAKKLRTPAGWGATVRNSMRKGWSLEGFRSVPHGTSRPDPTGNRGAATDLLEDLLP